MTLEYDFTELRDENEKIVYELQCTRDKLEAKDTVIKNLHKTVEKLSSNLSKTIKPHPWLFNRVVRLQCAKELIDKQTQISLDVV